MRYFLLLFLFFIFGCASKPPNMNECYAQVIQGYCEEGYHLVPNHMLLPGDDPNLELCCKDDDN